MALYDAVRLPRAVCSIALLAVLAVLAVGTGGCTSAIAKYIMEPGSSHVAVLSVTRWDDYKAELQPTFDLKEKEALEKATPDTMVLEQAVLDVFRASVSAKLANNKDPNATKPKDSNGVGAMPAKQITPLTDANRGAFADLGKIDKDPMLEYLAATALYQEVKMLNRYVKDANIRKDCKAYVVRLQVAQMPGIRESEYDLYMNIGFFFDEFNKSLPKNRNTLPKKEDRNTPLIVPLLVTDQVEGALQSRRAERLTEIVFALSAAYAGISGTVNVDAINQEIERTLGRRYNSLLTVGRLGDNVIRVRLGARQVPASKDKYEAIPRTHNISLLVIVPRTRAILGDTVFIGTRREFHRPTTGYPWLPDILGLSGAIGGVTVSKDITDLWKSLTGKALRSSDKDEVANLMKAICFAQNGRYEEFLELFEEGPTRNGAANNDDIRIDNLNRLWLDLVSADTYSNYDATQFSVPVYPDSVPGIACTDATLLDDGDATVATINMVKDIDTDTVSAIWTFVEPEALPGERITLAATKAELRAKSQLLLTFPSAKKFKRTVAQPTCDANCPTGEVKEIDPSRQLLYVTFMTFIKDSQTGETKTVPKTVALKWHYALANKPEPIKALKVERSTEKLRPNAACAVTLFLDFTTEGKGVAGEKDSFWMRVSGATLDPNATNPLASAPPGVLKNYKEDPLRWTIKKPGAVTLNFKPLTSGTCVKVRFEAPDGMTVEPKDGFDFSVSDPSPPPKPNPTSKPAGQ